MKEATIIFLVVDVFPVLSPRPASKNIQNAWKKYEVMRLGRRLEEDGVVRLNAH